MSSMYAPFDRAWDERVAAKQAEGTVESCPGCGSLYRTGHFQVGGAACEHPWHYAGQEVRSCR